MNNHVQHARILIIDDEPANLKVLDRILETEGYAHRVLVQDSREALSQYQQAPTDLILLDINMPYLDGFAVLAQLMALADPLLPPVVVLTAQHDQAYLTRALTEGARDFITKPFNRIELLARVRNLIEAHFAHRWLYDQKEVLADLVRQRTEEVQRTRLQIIHRLGRAAEYRDNETGYHIIRMSQMTAALAHHLGWDDEQCELILNASPMHDIGKIGIPDTILLKPGRFEPEEWEIMQTHAQIGADLLAGDDSPLLQMARSIALTHHEKWDGSGYPHGLAGTDIPQAGRIAAVTDVFDALTSSRPYKQAWPQEEAIAFIQQQSGSHFDPEIVEQFVSCLPELLAIRTRYPDTP